MQTTLDRASYNFTALSADQYEAIVDAGDMGLESPMHGQENYQGLMAAAKGIDADPRVLLSGLLFEGHMGADPNLVAASVNNLSGIKWAGQASATDSGIPADTGGTYAAFATLTAFFGEYARTLVNEYIGPYFNAGDMANAWSVYIQGRPNSGHGQERVDQWAYYRDHYPPRDTPGPVSGVYGADLIAMLHTQIGHPYSGDYDSRNGSHAWSYWCRAAVESTGRNAGLEVVAHTSALAAQQAAAAQGLLNTRDEPEHGAVVQFDTRFYSPDGHTGIWDADEGMLLGTLTDGTGIGYRPWGPGTYGYAGWYRLPGVLAPRRDATGIPPPIPSPDDNYVIPLNPYNESITDPNLRIGVGGGIKAKWQQTPDPLTIWGFPVANETQALVTEADGMTVQQRTIQRFERVTVLVQPEHQGTAWEIVFALRGQTITELIVN
jgi:hypothetical protein